jgi:hypothetical protein
MWTLTWVQVDAFRALTGATTVLSLESPRPVHVPPSAYSYRTLQSWGAARSSVPERKPAAGVSEAAFDAAARPLTASDLLFPPLSPALPLSANSNTAGAGSGAGRVCCRGSESERGAEWAAGTRDNHRDMSQAISGHWLHQAETRVPAEHTTAWLLTARSGVKRGGKDWPLPAVVDGSVPRTFAGWLF